MLKREDSTENNAIRLSTCSKWILFVMRSNENRCENKYRALLGVTMKQVNMFRYHVILGKCLANHFAQHFR